MALGWLKKKLSDVADDAWDAVTDVADAAVDAVGAVAESTGDVVGAAGTVVDTLSLGLASEVLETVDNTVLDTVDELTGGLVDVDFDDGNLSASVGVDGIAHVGAKVGEDGISHSSTLLDQSYDFGLTDDGFNVGAEAGINWGPLPYAGGSVQIEADGDVTAHGEIQGTIPTPIGVLSGEAKAAFVREGEMWGAQLDADGTLRLPSGSIVQGGVEAAYAQTADGSALSLGLEGSYTQPGVGTVGGSLGYDRLESGDMVAEHFEAGGYATGYGAHVEVGVSGDRVTTPQGSHSQWDVDGDLSLPGLGGGRSQPAAPAPEPMDAAPAEPVSAPEPATEFDTAIAAADEVEVSVDDMFSDLG